MDETSNYLGNTRYVPWLATIASQAERSLGDDPPRDRTSELRVLGFPSRHLGSIQMTTDTALGVTKRVVVDRRQLESLPYVDHPTIRFNAKESVEMPFRYIAHPNGEPVLPEGMKELLKTSSLALLPPLKITRDHSSLDFKVLKDVVGANSLRRPSGFIDQTLTGKTTLTSQTKAALQALPTPINAVVFSIDDLYLPYSGLTQLAQTHPDNTLLNGRGQPGTHDPVLGSDLLEQLAHINENGGEVHLPVFDKSAYGGYGDRSTEVVVVHPPVDVVILEGWCFGFQPLEGEELSKRYDSPDDPQGGVDSGEVPRPQNFFRSHSLGTLADINSNLRGYADLWYRYFTHFIQVVPENLHYVFEWRLQQEHAMKLKNGGRGMTDEQVHK
ncbi:hypothetical protein FRC10_012239 [Ceratobasidium sp. 414]|nr:hypothetical protein FRC10_012239 [Ceratobasidium sp. 414]